VKLNNIILPVLFCLVLLITALPEARADEKLPAISESPLISDLSETEPRTEENREVIEILPPTDVQPLINDPDRFEPLTEDEPQSARKSRINDPDRFEPLTEDEPQSARESRTDSALFFAAGYEHNFIQDGIFQDLGAQHFRRYLLEVGLAYYSPDSDIYFQGAALYSNSLFEYDFPTNVYACSTDVSEECEFFSGEAKAITLMNGVGFKIGLGFYYTFDSSQSKPVERDSMVFSFDMRVMNETITQRWPVQYGQARSGRTRTNATGLGLILNYKLKVGLVKLDIFTGYNWIFTYMASRSGSSHRTYGETFSENKNLESILVGIRLGMEFSLPDIR
jgi:hypothetical protein